MDATPPEFDANALAAMSAAWSLVKLPEAEVLSFLHENAPSIKSAIMDSLNVFIFFKGV
jgi:hypothetical protein